MVVRRSSYGFPETLERLLAAVERRELTVFAVVDHAAGARAVGLELEDETVVLFGNARAGTPLMQDDRTVGIELPLRLLVWREADEVLLGHLELSDLARDYRVERHGERLAAMTGLLDELAVEAAG